MIRKTLLVAVAAVATTAPLGAQALPASTSGPDSDVVERVVAVVGDSVVTLTQLQEYLIMMQASGQQIPEDPKAKAAVESQALEALVDQQLILQAAGQDSTLTPDDDDIEAKVEQALQQTVQRVGGESQFQQALAQEGLTQAEYRDQLKDRMRREQIQQMFMQKSLRSAPPVAVSEAELHEAFDSVKAQLGERPELLTFHQAVIRSGASDSAWAQAERQADTILAQVRAGGDFAELAKKYSEDPGSAANGGELGWFKRGQMVREFEEVAFRLRDGQISEPVKTNYGWHIIQVERRRPGEVKARHILIRPKVEEGASSVAEAMADTLARKVKAGTPLPALLPDYEGHLNTDIPDSLTVARSQLDQVVPPAWREPLKGASKGDVLGPFPYDSGGETQYVVIQVDQVRPAGEYTLDDLRDRLESQLKQQKQIERILQRLRSRAYVDIRL